MPNPKSTLGVALIMCEVFPKRPHAYFTVLNNMEVSSLMSVYVNGAVGMVYVTQDLFQHSEFEAHSVRDLFSSFCCRFAYVVRLHGFVLVQRGGLSVVHVSRPNPWYLFGRYVDRGLVSRFLVEYEATDCRFVLS